METVLQARGLQKRYGAVHALRGIDLDVGAGEVFGFLGPNGAGKTTFTKCITGFVRPDAGTVRIVGKDALADPTQVAPHIGLVPDQYDFYRNLTGRQHLDFYGRLLGMPAQRRSDRIAEVLALVRMEERADSRVKGYSHGMKQRICIAQAILHEPQLILFDEPTNGLDPQGAYELRELIKGLSRNGATVFLNSHLMHEVEQVCQRVAILDKGELKAVAAVADLRRGSEPKVRIRVLNPTQALATRLQAALPGAAFEGTEVVVRGGDKEAAAAVEAVVKAGGKVVQVQAEQASLESAFLSIVGGGQ